MSSTAMSQGITEGVMAERKDTLLEQLLPYRGRGWLLKDDLGLVGMSALAQLCNFSPTEASEFLCGDNSMMRNVARIWTEMGIRTKRRNHWRTQCAADYTPGQAQFEGGLSLDDWEKLYLQETSRMELAPVFEWRLPSGTDEATLVCVSDLHYGPPNMDLTRWLRLRDWIAEHEEVRWVGLGDFLDTAVQDAPGLGGDGQILPYDIAVQLLERHLMPIAKQCLLLLSGNHEARVANKLKLRHNPLQSTAERLGVPYRGSSSYLRLRLRRGRTEQHYDGFLHHGITSARTIGGKLAALYRTLEWNAIDFLVMGHTHAKVAVEAIRKRMGRDAFEQDGGCYVRLENHVIPLAYCGSFLKDEPGSYSRDMALGPANLGAVDLRFALSRHAVHFRV